MKLRQFVYPVSSIGSTLAFPIILGGLFLSYAGYHVPWLITAGIWLFAAAVAFTIITLPVEFNASRRALRALTNGRFLTDEELSGARAVLQAAALTYVAAAAAAVLQLIRLLMITRGRD
jgi:Zn-dependent membrane protease YugP